MLVILQVPAMGVVGRVLIEYVGYGGDSYHAWVHLGASRLFTFGLGGLSLLYLQDPATGRVLHSLDILCQGRSFL